MIKEDDLMIISESDVFITTYIVDNIVMIVTIIIMIIFKETRINIQEPIIKEEDLMMISESDIFITADIDILMMIVIISMIRELMITSSSFRNQSSRRRI